MLPRRDGLSVIAGLRSRGNTTPVLILSALGAGRRSRHRPARRRRRLSAQALCLLRAARPRRGARPPRAERQGSGDGLPGRRSRARPAVARRSRRAGREIVLQPREFRLLEYLMTHAGQVVTRTMLLENVWDYHFDPQTNVIDVHVSRLRAKIEKGFDSRCCTPCAAPATCSRPAERLLAQVPRRSSRPPPARLSALYLLLFAVCAVVLVFYMTCLSERMLTAQTQGDHQRGGAGPRPRLQPRRPARCWSRFIERRSRQPGANLYLIADADGRILAGNVESLEPGVLEIEGWTERAVRLQRYGEAEADSLGRAAATTRHRPTHAAIAVRVPLAQPDDHPGRPRPRRARALPRRRCAGADGWRSASWGWARLLIWFFVGRRALKRIDGMSEASRRIMGGDLAGRLPVSGAGDEFDRLSETSTRC